eukprot:TRINITY_DN3409_c0_g1_i1.p1 TRINITY_DN3409_c0_g1~~TRINITY_DN3409_c0_g1_i1.p1  ORF type:complete len:615 (+),score=109.49 TRINITY_DN3409_c0_g1_i1:123-1967(+)
MGSLRASAPDTLVLSRRASVSVQRRIGKAAFASRYHPHREVTEDYDLSSKVLGSGSFASVLFAESRRPSAKGLKFAVKTLQMAGLSAEQRQRVATEVEIFLQTDHPHVTRLHDVYETPEEVHLVMECMEGGTLHSRLEKKGKFAECEAADALQQLLLALSYLHSLEIVHRDLTLHNILYDCEGSNHLKLIDFGIACICEPEAKMTEVLGAPQFVAPEVLAKSYTSQCDMWGLGVVAFALLTRRFPFHAPVKAAVLQNVKKGSYFMPARFSAEAKGFIDALLRLAPEERLTARAALEHPFIVQRKNAKATPIVVCQNIVDGLRSYQQASRFRRSCLQMMAWSLSNEDSMPLRGYFQWMDKNQQGTISLPEMKAILTEELGISAKEAGQILEAFDMDTKHALHYSDFLAAMTSTRTSSDDDLHRRTFDRFDAGHAGYRTEDNLCEVLGEPPQRQGGDLMRTVMRNEKSFQDEPVGFQAFAEYFRAPSLYSCASTVALRCIGKPAQSLFAGPTHCCSDQTFAVDPAVASSAASQSSKSLEESSSSSSCRCSSLSGEEDHRRFAVDCPQSSDRMLPPKKVDAWTDAEECCMHLSLLPQLLFRSTVLQERRLRRRAFFP